MCVSEPPIAPPRRGEATPAKTHAAMNRKNSKGGGKKPRVEVVFDPDARK